MAAHKNQHFVPQFYLRNFSVSSTKKMVSLYHMPSSKYVPAAPIRSEACEDQYYKSLSIESALGDIEKAAARVIGRVIDGGPLPKHCSEDHYALLWFTIVQTARTPIAAAQSAEVGTATLAKLVEEFPESAPLANEIAAHTSDPIQTALSTTAAGFPMTLDLRCKLLTNATAVPFVTSDHPAVKYNRFLEDRLPNDGGTGLVCKGLEVFLPLSPRRMLVFFDSDVYQVGGRSFRNVNVQLTSADDVNALNCLQVASADEKLYFSESATQTYIRELVTSGRKYRPEAWVTATKHPLIMPDGSRSDVLKTSAVGLRMKLQLSCMRVLPSAAKKPLDRSGVQARDGRLVALHAEFMSEVMSGKVRHAQFGKWLRDRFGDAQPS